ncbi:MULTISPECIES: poly-beta-1,6-N-acetyl-D-glucosamine N-deacetylase PgaB [unclassified Brenneria]|uniref:poly-beta-1,6-N-acetyl-D-glucosamine N-deacetylase PgaB n=1 Tax=unclassified Brenneria TaxID=2634434 RepID=UPI001555CBEA|nr:poly-beta-1,6-N-acetyl-D-glucosamine N-deacetylase PgaB [Brenneria sp. L3-3C-1]NPD00046.1 poly-beta-1,6-N-acetyl-D-glucosamine N-deacetylase PgaB [Brenneria sp. hezel4-2-4]
MLLIRLRYLLITLGMLMIAACSQADRPAFVAPSERPLSDKEQVWPANHYIVLAYHDVEDDAADQRFMSVRTSALNEQFVWLRENGYQPISVDDILRAQAGGRPLPEKAVLLTFDDGYSSFYHRVYPLLQAYRWPAVLAPVGDWLDTPADQPVDFGGQKVPRERFLFWRQVREMSQSGLVEVGAHTYAQHKGDVANPQGNLEPHAVNRLYYPHQNRYETLAEYRRRIGDDIDLITRRITEATGKAPRVWVWPYGAAGGEALKIVKQRGYQMALTLEQGMSSVQATDNVPRLLVANNPDIKQFAQMVVDERAQEIMRVAHIDLDYVYDPDPAQQTQNLDELVQRVADLGINTVFLQAFADPNGDGNVQELYFPNRWLPVRADLFNHVAWQLSTRANVSVYAWMPVLAFDFNDKTMPRVEKIDLKSGERSIDAQQYKRLSPWNSENKQRIIDIYEDLASHASFNGILFHDDAVLAEDEDASADALKAYQAAGFPDSIAAIQHDPQLLSRWTRFKSTALIEFTQTLAAHVRAVRGPQIKTARNIYAMPILEPESEEWFAQNLDDFLAAYDWTAPMAMPLMENVSLKNSNAWLEKLVHAVAQRPGALNKTVFELQAKDWRTRKEHWLNGALVAQWMKCLQLNGAQSYGYYPDDFLNNKPELKMIRPVFSAGWYPQP